MAYGIKAIQRTLLQMKYIDRMYSTLVRTWSTVTLPPRGSRAYFLSACACPSLLAPPDPAPPDSPAPGGATPLTPPAPAPFDPRNTASVLCMNPRSRLVKALDLGEELLDALILRVAPPPCDDAELLCPLSDIASSRGERFGQRAVAVDLLYKAGHGDTEPEGGHFEASLVLGTEQSVQLPLCLWKPSLRLVVLHKVPGNICRGLFYDLDLALGQLGDVRLGGANRL